jgi:phenylacetate 2-hydroxylase
MSYQTIGIALVAAIFFIIRYFNRTDTPKVKDLPEIPGIPLFGNLLQFGSNHAKVAGELATKYGPVFQVRLGNRVRLLAANTSGDNLTETSGSYLQTLSILFVICGLPTSQH